MLATKDSILADLIARCGPLPEYLSQCAQVQELLASFGLI